MALELQGISRVVGGKVHIHPTDLTLQKGTMNVLLGPTLSGKTSLMRLMAGLDAPTQGTIRWNGADVTGQRVQDRGVAMVYQQFINYPGLSVYENIASPLRVAGRPASEIDAKVRETAELMRLTPMLGRKPLELSGGQQKQLEVARALLLDPKLILIDEPSIGLSPNLVQEVFRTLIRLRDQGVTILMVEQNAKAALAMSDYGLVLELGQTRMHDRADVLLNDPRVGHLFLGGHIEDE